MAVRRIKGDLFVDFWFHHSDGRRERVRKRAPVQTRTGAAEYERQLRSELISPSRKKEVPRFDEFAKRWFETYPAVAGNRPTEVRAKRIAIEQHLVPAFGHRRLDEVTAQRIDDFTARKIRDGKSKKTVHNLLSILARCLRSALEWEELDRMPVIRKPRVPLPDFDWFKPDESKALLQAARDEQDRTLLTFAIDTGARAGEQLAVEWGDVDFHGSKVVFRRSSTRGEVGPTKSGKTREVPMTRRLAVALKSYRHLRGPLVFCRQDGKPFTLWQLHEVLWRTCRRAGLREIRWHDLRHTFASQLVAKGVPLRVVQAWLGHSSITMVLRYAHLAPGENAHLIQVLENEGFSTGLGNSWATEGSGEKN